MSTGGNLTAPAAASTVVSGTGEKNIKIYAGADAFGCAVKDAIVSHLRSVNGVDVVDLGVDKYYTIAAKVGTLVADACGAGSTAPETRGILCCGTGIGVAMFANKYPGVYAANCNSVADAVNSRSINACNVLAVSSGAADIAGDIVDAWISTPFKAPCPASGDAPWPDEIQSFLDNAPAEMMAIPNPNPQNSNSNSETPSTSCAICFLRKSMTFEPVDIMPGGEMRIVRESPTSAYVRFKAGSVEPAHHHTFGHDLVVIKGKKKVWNLTKNESYGLEDGDFLFTPAGDVHRVKYFEDTEFFIRWDGHWDIFLDEDLDAAKEAIDKELAQGN